MLGLISKFPPFLPFSTNNQIISSETLKTKIVSIVLRLKLSYGKQNIIESQGFNASQRGETCYHG